MSRIFLLLAPLFLLLSAGNGNTAKILDPEELLRNLRETRSIPSDIKLELKELEPSSVPPLLRAVIEAKGPGTNESFTIHLSTDGRYFFLGEPQDLSVNVDQENLKKIDLKRARFLGMPDAPITIVEFSDLQCPYCLRADGILSLAMKQFKGKVRRVYKHFPLKAIHPWAMAGAIGAECAARQNPQAFWSMADAFYAEQKSITKDNLRAKMLSVARESGLDEAKFTTCLEQAGPAADVEQDIAEAKSLGINSTPTIFVNGHRVSGLAGVESLSSLIKEILENRHP